MKPTQHLRFVRVTGGYVIHWIGCDCPEAEPSPYFQPTPLQVPSASLTEAAARLYRTSPVSATGPHRFVLGACATSVPLHQEELGSWATHHTAYMGVAAQALWLSGQNALADAGKARAQRRQRADGDADGGFWPEEASDVRADMRTAYRANHYARLLGVEGVTSVQTARLHADILVTRAEILLGDMLEAVLWPPRAERQSPMEAAYALVEVEADRGVARELQVHLAEVRAHRALRSLVQ